MCVYACACTYTRTCTCTVCHRGKDKKREIETERETNEGSNKNLASENIVPPRRAYKRKPYRDGGGYGETEIITIFII